MRFQASKWRYAGAVALLLAVYLGSEWQLRKKAYPPLDPQARAQSLPFVANLPPLLRIPLERRMRVAKLREQLAKAATAEAFYKAERELEKDVPSAQWPELYEEGLRRYPQHYLSGEPLVALVAAGRGRTLDDFIRFADALPPNRRNSLWASLWNRSHSLPAPDQRLFLEQLFKRAIVDPALVSAYAACETAFLKQNLAAEADAAARLQRECLARVPAPKPPPRRK